MASDKQIYEFTEDGWFLGTFYKAGERIMLHPRQAAHNLHRMKPAAAPAEKTAKSKTKADG